MFGVGFPELVVILVIALLVFGPGKLPEIGSSLGQGIRDFRRAFEGHDLPDNSGAPTKTDAHANDTHRDDPPV